LLVYATFGSPTVKDCIDSQC